MKPPYYKFLPDESLFRYVRRIIKNVIAMYPYACEHGFRYYVDTRFRRKISHKRRKAIRKEREGPFHSKAFKAKLKDDLIERDGQQCRWCKLPLEREQLTIDHILMLARGGTNDLYNLQLLCVLCHGEKCSQENRGEYIVQQIFTS